MFTCSLPVVSIFCALHSAALHCSLLLVDCTTLHCTALCFHCCDAVPWAGKHSCSLGGRWHRVHPALYKSLGSAAGEQKGETCCQEKTCVADPTMGQRDPAREPDTEPGGVARPSEYRRAGACDEPHDSPGHRPGPSSGYRPPPDSETQIEPGERWRRGQS